MYLLRIEPSKDMLDHQLSVVDVRRGPDTNIIHLLLLYQNIEGDFV